MCIFHFFNVGVLFTESTCGNFNLVQQEIVALAKLMS